MGKYMRGKSNFTDDGKLTFGKLKSGKKGKGKPSKTSRAAKRRKDGKITKPKGSENTGKTNEELKMGSSFVKTKSGFRAKVVQTPKNKKFISLPRDDEEQVEQTVREIVKNVSYKKLNWKKPKGGIIYVSSLPYGFFEDGLMKFFEQFGKISRLALVRSKMTGRSCGYAFIEYVHYEVAKIVAATMDGYFTFGKILKCKLVPEHMVKRGAFENAYITPQSCRKVLCRVRAIETLNKQRTDKQELRRHQRITHDYRKKLKALRARGIDVDLKFPRVRVQGMKKKAEKLEELARLEREKTKTNTSESAEAGTTGEGEEVDGVEDVAAGEVDGVEDVAAEEVDGVEDGAAEEVADDGDHESCEGVTAALTEAQREAISLEEEKLAKKIKENLAAKLGPASVANNEPEMETPKKLVLEVDESEDEITFKTPPNAVKKFVKSKSSVGKKKKMDKITSGSNTPKTPASAKKLEKEAGSGKKVQAGDVDVMKNEENGAMSESPALSKTPAVMKRKVAKKTSDVGPVKRRKSLPAVLSNGDINTSEKSSSSTPIASNAISTEQVVKKNKKKLNQTLDSISSESLSQTPKGTPKKKKTPLKRKLESQPESQTPQKLVKEAEGKTPQRTETPNEKMHEEMTSTPVMNVEESAVPEPTVPPAAEGTPGLRNTQTTTPKKKTPKGKTGKKLVKTPSATPVTVVQEPVVPLAAEGTPGTETATPLQKKTPKGKKLVKTPSATPATEAPVIQEPAVNNTPGGKITETTTPLQKKTPKGKKLVKTPSATPVTVVQEPVVAPAAEGTPGTEVTETTTPLQKKTPKGKKLVKTPSATPVTVVQEPVVAPAAEGTPGTKTTETTTPLQKKTPKGKKLVKTPSATPVMLLPETPVQEVTTPAASSNEPKDTPATITTTTTPKLKKTPLEKKLKGSAKKKLGVKGSLKSQVISTPDLTPKKTEVNETPKASETPMKADMKGGVDVKTKNIVSTPLSTNETNPQITPNIKKSPAFEKKLKLTKSSKKTPGSAKKAKAVSAELNATPGDTPNVKKPEIMGTPSQSSGKKMMKAVTPGPQKLLSKFKAKLILSA